MVFGNDIFEKLAAFEAGHPGCLYYLNLTDGIEAGSVLLDLGIDPLRIRFSSVCSSYFERKSLDGAIGRLGADFLMELALGSACCLVDFGTKRELSRAVYQGVPFVKYCLERNWFDISPHSVFITPRSSSAEEHDVADLYGRWYHGLDRSTKGFLRRFKKYARNRSDGSKDVRLFGVSTSTSNDGHPDYYISLARSFAERRSNGFQNTQDVTKL